MGLYKIKFGFNSTYIVWNFKLNGEAEKVYKKILSEFSTEIKIEE